MPSSPPETTATTPEVAASPPRWRLHAQLFAATVASVFYTGLDGGKAWWRPSLSGESMKHGLLFAGSLLAILVAHESGHYVAARLHKVSASLPYFIPMPLVSPFGTMGAVIRMSGTIRTRNALLDIGASGPLAGLVFAIPLYLWGTAHPQFVEPSSAEGLANLGESILTRVLDHFAAPPTPPNMLVLSSPVAFGSWAGLFVTMINLLPVGQLDGGHVAYALLGPRQDRVAVFVHRSMLAFFFVSVTSFVLRDVRSGLGLHHLGDAVGNSVFWLVWFEALAILGSLSSQAQGPSGERAARETIPIRTRATATVSLALLAGFGREHGSPLLWGAWFAGLGLLLAMEARSGVLRSHSLLDHPPTSAAPLDRARTWVAVVTLPLLRSPLHADADRAVTIPPVPASPAGGLPVVGVQGAAPASAPPPGAPWDLPVHEAPLAFLDLEMTGLDPAVDRVVEVCVDRVVGGRSVELFHSLVRPDTRIGGASHVHGLDDAALAGAPPFEAVADRILHALDGAILVAHAAEWDATFLLAEMKRAGRDVVIAHWIDTLVLARRSFAFGSYSLDALCKSLSIDRGRAHRADSDVAAMRAVFERCVAVLAPESARDLWEVKIAQRRARAAIVGACEAAVEHGLPVQLVYRPARKAAETLQMILTEVRSDLDLPRAIGYLLPGRGRRELRADRILRVDPGNSPTASERSP